MQNYRPAVCLITLLLLCPTVFLTVGCQKQEASSDVSTQKVATTAKPAAPDPKTAQQIEANPNMPPQVKAMILDRMKGKGDTKVAPPAK